MKEEPLFSVIMIMYFSLPILVLILGALGCGK